ncbi:type 4a pilus biogenesis protein PilO [Litoribacillus peritrichatus]|uniref:Type 4a pilus biogenesis protein PilO n=1 Tax=Litoribacillus peritrichatus TaxID=718191 RepID=A0ABP7MT62_9GAMM
MSLSDSIQKLNELDLNDIDFNNIGSWPIAGRVFILALVMGLVLAAGFWFHIKGLGETYESEVAKEKTLKEDFEIKAFKVANLGVYKQQMTEMEETFGALLRQLPSDTEVAGLLEDITHTGLGSGLKFETIDLQPELKKEFYIELPFKIRVEGSYHELGSFVSGVAGLPRIVTLHDLDIKNKSVKNKEEGHASGVLVMDVLAKTYRYNETKKRGAN